LGDKKECIPLPYQVLGAGKAGIRGNRCSCWYGNNLPGENNSGIYNAGVGCQDFLDSHTKNACKDGKGIRWVDNYVKLGAALHIFSLLCLVIDAILIRNKTEIVLFLSWAKPRNN
jgi:hypothetical protein